MSSSLSSSCHHNGQQEKGHTCNANKKQEQQRQQNFTKNQKSYGNASRQTQRTAADSTSHLKFECISQHFNDNDEIIAALLNAFQLQTHFNNVNTKNTNNADQQTIQKNAVTPNIHVDNDSYAQQHTAHHHNQEKLNTESSSAFCCANNKNLLFISPKLLLNKLRLCHYNKYWLVQNKYAEVISNLNYASLRSYYGNKYTNNLNAQNHNGCCICKSNCCSSSSSSSLCSCCCYCCCCCGSAVDDEDDIDHMDFVCNLEVRILDYLFVTYLSYVVFFLNHITKGLLRSTYIHTYMHSYVCTYIYSIKIYEIFPI